MSLVHIRSRLTVEGFPWEKFRPLLAGSLSDLPGCRGLGVPRLVVDDPAQAGGQQILSVGERSQHVKVPGPVDVQGRQVGQVRVRAGTAVFYQGDPTLLIPRTEYYSSTVNSSLPGVYLILFCSPPNIIISLFTFSELASQHFPLNTEASHQNI